MLTGFIKKDQLNDSFDGLLFYAHEDGDLADHEWLHLDENGKECDHLDENCGCSWYYFKGLEIEKTANGEKLVGGAIMGKERPVGNEGICLFKNDGKMVSRDWCDEDTPHYYTSKGFRAVNRWLPINGYWYEFDANGKVKTYNQIDEEKDLKEGINPSNTASRSNAPYPIVTEVKPVKDTIEVPVGQKGVKVEFQATLATKSNPERKYLTGNDHDIRFKGVKGKVEVTNKDKGICTVTFDAPMVEAEEQIVVYIDDVKSASAIVKTVIQKADNNDGNDKEEVKKEDVNKALDNILNSVNDTNVDTNDIVEGLKGIYSNENVNNDDVHEYFLTKEEDLKKVEDKHIVDKNITKEDPSIAEKVKEDIGSVEVTGSALNAEPGETVQLKVDEPQDDRTLEGNYEKTAAFDIRLVFTDAEGNKRVGEQLNIPVIITMDIPTGFTQNGLMLFNLHGDKTIKVKISFTGDGKLRFAADRFSTYVFAQTTSTNTNTNPSGGGGGRGNNVNSALTTNSGTNSGEWILDATGWWIRLKDGTYPVNTWMYLDYNGVYKWYRFDAAGYMSTGWYTDTDGRKYYLNPVSDGTKGAMLTGWQFIDGFWYYFNPVSDGTQGALLVNTTTPDGYVVNANGQWIQ